MVALPFSNKGVPKVGPERGSATTKDLVKINGNTYLFNEYGVPVYGLQKIYLDKEESSSQVTETVPQSITGKKSYTKVYGSKPFKLNAKAEGTLSYTSSNKKVAEAGKDGTITIKGTGKAVITVKAAATGQYKAASKKITITVKPEKTSGIKVKAANKKITASWKKTAKADGYKIQYSTAKSFKDAKEVTAAGTSKLIKGLKSKTTYYVRVCAYVKDGSRKITGAYSKTVKAAVK